MHLAPSAIGPFATIAIGYLCSAPLGVRTLFSRCSRKVDAMAKSTSTSATAARRRKASSCSSGGVAREAVAPSGPKAGRHSPPPTVCPSTTPTTACGWASGARRFWTTSICARRSCTSITSASPSAWCTPEGLLPTARFGSLRPIENLTCAAISERHVSRDPDVRALLHGSRSRGSADTARDVRGFAVRFYTGEGNWDLVGNNIPVFFIQDGIKFPDLIHAAKPEPDREIPQAQTAHDTFWDFASLTPESTHMLMWVMSDRAIPRSYRTMEGFGVHTFRLVNAKGKTTLVKFHWKPAAGLASLVWEEAQKLGGIDPDFHRRDLWDAIESGRFRSGTSGFRSSPTTRIRPSKESTCSTPPTRSRGTSAGPDHRSPDAEPEPDQLLLRDRTGRVLHRHVPGASTSPTTHSCRPATSRTWTPS